VFSVVWPLARNCVILSFTYVAARFCIPTRLKILNFISFLQCVSLHFLGLEAQILCIAHELNSHTAFHFKDTKDICLGVRRPDRLAHLSTQLVCLQGMHLDPWRWTNNYALIILINSVGQGPSWKTKSCWASKRSYFMQLEDTLSRWKQPVICPYPEPD